MGQTRRPVSGPAAQHQQRRVQEALTDAGLVGCVDRCQGHFGPRTALDPIQRQQDVSLAIVLEAFVLAVPSHVDHGQPREVEVLAAVAHGPINADTGRTLFIGQAMVTTHLLRIFTKLVGDNRSRAVTMAMERGILAVPGR